jgi:hypothetical protein
VGILLIGIGLGLFVLISLADNSWRDGLGVGGLVAFIGLAFLVIGLLDHSDVSSPSSSASTPVAGPPRAE